MNKLKDFECVIFNKTGNPQIVECAFCRKHLRRTNLRRHILKSKKCQIYQRLPENNSEPFLTNYIDYPNDRLKN